jgi:hypothetical protein
MQDRTNPHARHLAFEIAGSIVRPGVSPGPAAVAVALNGIGDTCPDCLRQERH